MISKMTEPCILWGDIQIPTEKDNSVSIDLKDHKTLHPLWGNSNPNWKSKIVIEMITKMTYMTLHSLWGHSTTNWKRQFSIEIISNMKQPYTFFLDIEIPTEIDSSVLKWLQRWQNLTFFVGTSKFWLKKQLSIEMISKITELYILCLDIQVPTEKKNSLVLKWFQKWQNHAFFVETFMFQLKNQFSIEMI